MLTKILGLDYLRGRHPCSPWNFGLIKVSLCTWVLGPWQTVYANNVIYEEGLEPPGINLTIGGAGDWETEVHHGGSRDLRNQYPIKISGHKGSRELLWLVTLHACCHTLLRGDLSAVHTAPAGEAKWKLWLDFSRLCFVCLSSLLILIFTLSPWV